jgi:hypothetical protein
MSQVMLALLALFACGAALAQSEGQNDPRVPEAKVPPVPYRSVFEDYRPYREQELASWRQVNEEVGRIGGHIGVLKDAEKAARPQKEDKHGMHR